VTLESLNGSNVPLLMYAMFGIIYQLLLRIYYDNHRRQYDECITVKLLSVSRSADATCRRARTNATSKAL